MIFEARNPEVTRLRAELRLGDPSASNKIFEAEAEAEVGPGEVLGVSPTTVENDWAMARA